MPEQNKRIAPKEKPIEDGTVKVKVTKKTDEGPSAVYKLQNKKQGNMGSISDFYRGRSGNKTALSRIEKKDPGRRKKIIAWVIIGLVVILGVTLGGLYYFISQEDKFGSDSIGFEVIVPTLISSGDNIGITLNILNQEDVDINDTELIMQYPNDFIFNSSDPIPNNEANNTWTLGTIRAGSSKTINFSGQVFGEMNSTKNIKMILNYTPENFSSEFKKEDSFDLSINDTVYDLSLTVPSKAVSGFSSPYSVKITNKSEEDVDNLKLILTIPDNLSVTSFNPEPDLGESTWEIDALPSGEEFEITYEATLTGNEGDMAEIKAEVGYVNKNNDYIKQADSSAIVFLVNPQMVLTMSINDSTEGFPVSMGDNLKYKITYQNNSQSEIRDLVLTADLDGVMLDWDTLADNNDGLVEDGVITWDKDKIENFAAIKPGDEGELLFNINLLDAYNYNSEDDINFSITSLATATSDNVVDLDDGTLEILSNEVVNEINSDLVLRAEGRYYDDEYIKVGAGPLPPESGKTTKYRIYWYIRNGANEVQDVIVSAILPEGVSWTGDTKVNAGSISFDQESGQVNWSINKIPEHVGQFFTELQASFEVSITPTDSDVGQVMVLSQASQMSATDSFTKEELTINRDLISTVLTDDPLYVGDGLVVASSSTNTNSNSNTNSNTNSATNTNTNSNTNLNLNSNTNTE